MYRAAAVLLVAAVGCALAQDPVWPAVPTKYSTVVSANFDQRGYTLSYSEYYDGTRLRVDGRYTDTDIAQIWDFSSMQATQWAMSDVYTCNVLDINAIDAGFRNSFAIWWSPAQPPVFAGYSTAARTINCATFTTTVTSASNGTEGVVGASNSTILETFYLRAADNVPVRLWRTGTGCSQDRTTKVWTCWEINEYIDWVFFVAGEPETKWFSKPSNCPSAPQGNPDFPSVQIPAASTVVPQPTNPESPLMQSAFRLVLEAKLTTTSQSITSMRWYLDMSKNKERLDYIGDDGKVVQLVYDYSQTPNILWNATLGGVCVTSYATAANANPLYSRAGSLPALFKRGGWFTTPTARYEGRIAVRGVDSDSFVQRQQLVNAFTGAIFDFDMHVMFFPGGWQFPGRSGVDATQQLAIRVINSGTMKEKGSATNMSYSDVWDIFQLVPTEQAPGTFNAVSQWGCQPLPPQPEEEHGTSNAGTIAGVIVGVLLAGALAYGAYRWWRSHRGTFHAGIQGMVKAQDVETTGAPATASAGAQV